MKGYKGVIENRRIPRIVHQTFARIEDLSPEILEKNRQLEILNPDYIFEYYDDVRVDSWIEANCDDQLISVFRSINPNYGAAKADLFRYLLIYKTGGIYLDIKSTCIKPLDLIVNPLDEFIISRWELDPLTNNRRFGRHMELQKLGIDEFQQWFLISIPFNPIILSVIQEVTNRLSKSREKFRTSFGRLGVYRLTGPIVFSKVVASSKNLKEWREIDSFAEGFRYKLKADSGEIDYVNDSSKHYSKLFQPIVSNGSFSRMKIQTIFNLLIFQWFEKIHLFSYIIGKKIFRLQKSTAKNLNDAQYLFLF